MELEYVSVLLTKNDLRAIKKFVRNGIKYCVKEVFVENEKIEDFIENSNDELETLSSLCSLYGESNFHQYAVSQFNSLKDNCNE